MAAANSSMLGVEDVKPPTYDDTVTDARAQLNCGETPKLFLDKTTIFANTSPPRALYELSNAVTEAKSPIYGVQKVVYRVSQATGSDSVRTKLDHIYDFTQDPLKGLESFKMQTNDVVVIQGQKSSKRTYKEVHLMPGVGGWKVKDHFKVGDSPAHQLKHENEVHWKNMSGEVVAVEMLPKRDKGKTLLNMPQLDIKVPMEDKELDLLVTCWMARLWRQSADETKQPMTWQDCKLKSFQDIPSEGESAALTFPSQTNFQDCAQQQPARCLDAGWMRFTKEEHAQVRPD